MAQTALIHAGALPQSFLLDRHISDEELFFMEIFLPAPAAKEPIEEASGSGRKQSLQIILVHLLLINYKIEDIVFKQLQSLFSGH